MPRSLRRSRILLPTCASIGRARAVSSWTVLRLIPQRLIPADGRKLKTYAHKHHLKTSDLTQPRTVAATERAALRPNPGVRTRTARLKRAARPVPCMAGLGARTPKTAARQPN